MALKDRVLTKFPALVIAETGLSVDREGGEYTFALDMGSLTEIDSVPDQSASFIPVVTPAVVEGAPDVNNIVSLETLLGLVLDGSAALSAIVSGTAGTGIYVVTGTDTATVRSIAVGTGLSVSNGSGVAGNPTISLNVTGLTADASPDAAADYLLTYDTSAGTYKKALINAAIAAASSGVGSFIARTGTVTAQADDYASLAGAGANWNYGLDSSASAGALTITFTTAGGSTPSSTSPSVSNFRSSTASTGTLTARSTTASHTLVVPSGAELGVVANQQFHLYVAEFDDAGTKRPAVIKATSAAGQYPLRAYGIASATSIGTGSDSAGVFYSNAAITSKPYVIIGRLSWTTNPLATPGTWANKHDVIEVAGPDFVYPGEVIQSFVASDGTLQTGTTLIPFDATIPQNTEGDQYLSQAITPTSHANILVIETELQEAFSVSSWVIAALFRDSAADAIASNRDFINQNATGRMLRVATSLVAGSVASTTFKVRAGGVNAGTFSINGNSGVNYFGGTMVSFLRVSEIQA